MRRTRWTLVLALALLPIASPAEPVSSSGIAWQGFTDDLFARAAAQGRFVLLDMEAVWCHWCHVMDQQTYANPDVQRVIREKYIAVKVDQDSRPDLSIRYERYGWPATVIFGPDGTEIVKRRGFIRPDVMLSILEAVIEDPSPVPGIELVLPESYAKQALLAEDARVELTKRHRDAQDRDLGGLSGAYRYLPWEAVELALREGASGETSEREWAERTLRASRALIDPVWGGVYQYSVAQGWTSPHFEKIMQFQSENLRLYALASGQLGDPAYREMATDVVRYVEAFLTSSSGAFYTSQDADVRPGQEGADYYALGDAERRAIGVPRIDRNRYARENGWMIEALATLHEVSGDPRALELALRAARWVVAERSLRDPRWPAGGFAHGASDVAGPFLGDSLAMGRAFLALYRATAERRWLTRATDALAFIDAAFGWDGMGYLSAVPDGGPVAPIPQFDENLRLARFANLLHHYTGDERARSVAERALRYPVTPDIYGPRREIAGILLADAELASDPLHLTIVGAKADPQAAALYAAALRETAWYKRVEWWDPREGPLPNPDVTYPKLERAAAFVCTENTCSAPIRSPEAIRAFLVRQRELPAEGDEDLAG